MKNIFKKDTLTSAVALAGGAIVAGMVVKKLTPPATGTGTGFTIANEMLRNSIPVVAGIVLLANKNKMISNLGGGMIAAGGQLLAGKALGINGAEVDEVIEGVYEEEADSMAGASAMQNYGVINGAEEVINGYDDYSDSE